MSTVLVTGFEPFGLRTANASQQLVELISGQHEPGVVFDVLPVSSRSEHVLLERLDQRQPSGVLLMGEQLMQGPGAIRIEPYAIDAALWNLLALASPSRVSSPFAEKLLKGRPRDSSIQVQQCNRCYLRALEWAQSKGRRPVVFVHVPVLGDRAQHARQVREVLDALKAEVGLKS